MASTDDESGFADTVSSAEPIEEASAPAVPEHLELAGRYVLIDEIGEGGAGVVFRAFDKELERQVAIKLLNAGRRSHIRTMRMRREAQANALLAHPNVVSVFDVGEHDDELFIAMEYVDGGSLKDWLAEPRTPEEILDAFLQAGEGLFAAHEKGIIHRDFKPANVLMGRDGRARVADFGLARGVGTQTEDELDAEIGASGLVDRSLTRTGTIMGTPAYMAPEQFDGRMVDARADQFSFCLVLAEALAGERAPRGTWHDKGWSNEGWDPRSWLKKHSLPGRVRDALIRGLALDAKERFESLDAVLDAIRSDLGRSSSWRLTAGFAGMALIALVAGWAMLGDRQTCEGFETRLAGIWDGARYGALTAKSRPGPKGGWEQVWGALDRYKERWVGARAAICRATHERGVQSDELLDTRMTCLDRRLEGLRVLVALIEADRIESAEQASEALLRLPGPDECRQVGIVEGPPRPAEAVAEIEATEQTFAELAALYAAALHESGRERAEAIVERANETGYAPTRARAYKWLARLESSGDRYDEAARAWRRAALLAERGWDDELRLEALIELIRLDKGDPKTKAETDRLVERAEALADRIGGLGQRGAVGAVVAKLAFRRGDLVACRKQGEEAVLALENTPDVALFDRLQAKQDLAECLERQGLRKKSAAALKAALEEADFELGPDHPRLGLLQMHLSRALDFSGDAAGAEAAARRAVEITMATNGDAHSSTARAYQALANTMFRKGDYQASVDNLKRAIEIMTKVHGETSHQVGGQLSSLGLSLSVLKRYDEASKTHERAVQTLSAAVGPDHPLTAAAWGRLGANLENSGDCEGAIPHYRRAMETLRKADPKHARILDQIRGLAGCLIKLERYREARAPLLEGLALSQERDEPPFYTAILEFAAGQALYETGDRSRGRELASSAMARLAPEKDRRQKKLAEIRTWLETHR